MILGNTKCLVRNGEAGLPNAVISPVNMKNVCGDLKKLALCQTCSVLAGGGNKMHKAVGRLLLAGPQHITHFLSAVQHLLTTPFPPGTNFLAGLKFITPLRYFKALP